MSKPAIGQSLNQLIKQHTNVTRKSNESPNQDPSLGFLDSKLTAKISNMSKGEMAETKRMLSKKFEKSQFPINKV